MIMARRIVILLAGAVMLTGCNMAPDHIRPIGAIPSQFPQGGVYPAAVPQATDATAIGWRDFFVDSKLRSVIALGLENNRDLRVAAANVLQARAQYRVQRADLFPTVTASASHDSGRTPISTEGGQIATEVFSIDVGLSAFEIDLFGRVRNLSRAALEQYFATEDAQRAARISLIGEIASAFLTLAADKEQLVVSQEALESFRQSLELTRAQFRVGFASELDVRQAETGYQGARNDLVVLATQIAQDRNALNLLVGTQIAEELLPAPMDGASDYTLSDLPASLSSLILLKRPDVRMAEHQLAAQEANIGAARAAMFPTISLTSAVGLIANPLSGLFKAGAEEWNVTPSATLPLFDAGRRNANLQSAKASRQAAVATYEKALQTAFSEVADALAERGTIFEQVDARTARAHAATAAERLSFARYRVGVDSFLVALDSQRTAYSARQDLVTTRLARAENLVQLYRVFGGGLQ